MKRENQLQINILCARSCSLTHGKPYNRIGRQLIGNSFQAKTACFRFTNIWRTQLILLWFLKEKSSDIDLSKNSLPDLTFQHHIHFIFVIEIVLGYINLLHE